MSIIKNNNENLFLDEYNKLISTTKEILNDEIYDNEENIEEVRNDMEKIENDFNNFFDSLNEDIESNMEDIKNVSSIAYLLDILNKKNQQEKNNKISNTIKLVEDSLKLDILFENVYINKSKKINKEEFKQVYNTAYNKLNSSNKYQFPDIKDLKSILISFIKDEKDKKYIMQFLYYFFIFINKNKIEEYVSYITCIINNIKFLKIYPNLEQNRTFLKNLDEKIEKHFK